MYFYWKSGVILGGQKISTLRGDFSYSELWVSTSVATNKLKQSYKVTNRQSFGQNMAKFLIIPILAEF